MSNEFLFKASPSSGLHFERPEDEVAYKTCVDQLNLAAERIAVKQITEEQSGLFIWLAFLGDTRRLRLNFLRGIQWCGFTYETFDNGEPASSHCTRQQSECPLRYYGPPEIKHSK